MAEWWEAAPLAENEDEWWADAPLAEQEAALHPALGVSRDLVEGIPIVGPIYTGAMDWLGSEVIGRMTGESSEELRQGASARRDQYREENPLLSTGAQIVGGTVATAPLAATSLGARAFGLTQNHLLPRLAMGGLSGGTIAAGDTAVRGGDFGDVLVSAGVGSGLGAAGGAAAPHIARAVDGGVNAVARALFGAQPNRPNNMSRPAFEAVVRALDADGTLSNQGALNISRGGPGAMLADAGPNAQSLLDTAIQRSGPASRIATDAVEGRATQAHADIVRALDTALGAPAGVHSTETAMRQGTAAARGSAYDAAYASPIDYSSESGRALEALMGRVPRPVIDTANRMMAMEGQQSSQILADIAEDGTVTFLRQPDVRQLDYITRALNQAARSGEGQGALGGQTDIGRIYGNLARDIRDATRTAVPAYDTALQTAASPIRQREALQLGERLLSPGLARDEAGDLISVMTGPELAAVRQGVRSHVDEVLANVRAVASDPNLDARQARTALQNLSNPAAREKLSMALGDEVAAAQLFDDLDRAAMALQLRASVATNSRTFARQAVDEAFGANFDQGAVNQALAGKPVNAVQAVIQNITGRTPQGLASMKDEAYQQIAEALVGTRGDAAIDMLSLLAAANARPVPVAGYLPGVGQGASREIAELLFP